jgi:alkylation response protein AidB-like acyl-CoA dehydrogenase
MNFDFTDDQQAIKATAREFLADRFRLERVRKMAEAGSYDDGLWTEMAELGWPGIFIDEGHGGQGLGTVELAILMEELGYALAPSPFFSNAAAGLLIRNAGSGEQQDRFLPGIASGEAPGTAGEVRDGAALAADGGTAAVFALVEDGGGSLQTSANGMAVLESIDSTRALYRVPREAGEELPGDVPGAVDRVRVALAAELVGVSQRAMEMAVVYARERQQFGRPIGSYQAISHRCAQMLLEVEGARAATLYAAWAADHEPETLPLAASMAKAYASDAGPRVTASALQVHGGIGFTWEHDLHFFLKRANADASMFGSARELRDRVAGLAGIAAA